MASDSKKVIIYTDGGCEPNPGPGGYGAILIYGQHRKEISGGFRKTTNNRMELFAAIAALEALKEKCKVILFSDSKYLVESFKNDKPQKWRKSNWLRSDKKKASNIDLLDRLITQCERHQVEFVWVKGHAGQRENERCDELAREALQKDLVIDQGYESKSSSVEKVVREGQPCSKCSTPVIKKTPRRQKLKPGQLYYFKYYLVCPNCRTMYMVEAAKQLVNAAELDLSD